MRCIVSNCKSDSTKHRKRSHDVSFHRFPNEEEMDSVWLKAIHKEERAPCDRICSLHFTDEDLKYTKSGLRKLMNSAVPSVNIPDSGGAADEPKKKVSACRLCLAMDVKLHHITKYKLQGYYEEMLQVKVKMKDGLPRYVCYECAARLTNHHRFLRRCERVHQLLLDIIDKEERITNKIIRNIDRSKKKLTSPLSILSLQRSTTIVLKENDIHINYKPSLELTDETKLEIISKPEMGDQLKPHVPIKMEDDDFHDLTDDFHQNDDGFPDNSDDIKIRFNDKVDEVEVKHNENENDFENLEKANSFTVDNIYELEVTTPFGVESTVDKEQRLVDKDLCEIENVNVENFNNVEIDKVNDDINEDIGFNVDESLKTEMKLYSDVETNDKKVFELEIKPPFKSEYFPETEPNETCELTVFTKEHQTVKKVEKPKGPYIRERKKGRLLPRPMTCPDCGVKFPNTLDCIKHYKTAHKDGKALNKFTCETCGYSTPKRYLMEKHLLSHTGERPHKCPHCDFTFALRTNLTRHMAIHSGERPHQCPECDMRFVRRSTMTHHYKVIHLNPNPGRRRRKEHPIPPPTHHDNKDKQSRRRGYRKPVTCPDCNQECPTTVEYIRHYRTMHKGGRALNKYLCETCGYRALNKVLLMTHESSHTGERHYPCPQCGKRYSSYSNLKKHILTHTGEKRYECNDCGKRFTTKDSVKQHHLHVHLKVKWPKRDRTREQRRDDPEMPLEPPQNRPGLFLGEYLNYL